MQFFRKSIFRKLFLTLFLFFGLISALAFYLYYNEDKEVPYEYLLISLFFFSLVFFLTYWANIVRPTSVILSQMQALLAGKNYKRIYTTRIDEIGAIAHFFNQVTLGLGKASFDIQDRDRMLDELSVASSLQRDILPLENPNIPGLQIVAKNRPASEVGGDSFNILTANEKTYIYLGDVTGHGVAAGLIMTMVNSLFAVFADIAVSPSEIIINVNKYIKRHIKKAMFMTMVMLCWDHKVKKLSYVGAGHERILVYRAKSGVCDTILSGGVALGMVPDNSKLVKEKDIELEDGDLVILYTDGITEAKNVNGELYTLERLKKSLLQHAPRYSADGVNFHLAKDVSIFMEGHKQEDDMTLIVIKKDDKLQNVQVEKKETTNWQ